MHDLDPLHFGGVVLGGVLVLGVYVGVRGAVRALRRRRRKPSFSGRVRR